MNKSRNKEGNTLSFPFLTSLNLRWPGALLPGAPKVGGWLTVWRASQHVRDVISASDCWLTDSQTYWLTDWLTHGQIVSLRTENVLNEKVQSFNFEYRENRRSKGMPNIAVRHLLWTLKCSSHSAETATWFLLVMGKLHLLYNCPDALRKYLQNPQSGGEGTFDLQSPPLSGAQQIIWWSRPREGSGSRTPIV